MANEALVLVLAGVWVALLLPTALRARRGDARRVVGSRSGRVADRRGEPDVGEPEVYRFNEAAAAAAELQDATVEDAVADGVLLPQMAPLTSDERVERVAPRVPEPPVEAIRQRAERRRSRSRDAQRRATFFALLAVFLVSTLVAVFARGVFVPVAGLAALALLGDVVWLRSRVVRRRQAREVVVGTLTETTAAEDAPADDEVLVIPEASGDTASFDEMRRAVGQR